AGRAQIVAAIGASAGGALPNLLVSALRLCAAQGAVEGGCRRPHAGVLRAFPGKELSRRTRHRGWKISRVPAGGVEAFPRERVGQIATPETRRRCARPFT